MAVAIAVLKPWGVGREEAGRPSPTGTPAQPTVPSERPSATPSPTPDPDAITCISSTGWRVVTRDVTAGRESRSWIAVDPATAEGPDDASIPSVRVVVGRLLAIGYCVPAVNAHVQRQAQLWRITSGATPPDSPRPDPSSVAGPVAVSPLTPLTRRAEGVADLFGPPAGQPTWSAGRYVFALTLGRSSDPLWFSLEVVDSPPVPDPTPEAPGPPRPVRSP